MIRLSHKNTRTSFAFTLAEVLITLGIIGVVAAMSIPTLVAKYQKHQTVSVLKETYSILNNALNSGKNDYGTDVKDWPLTNTTKPQESTYFAEQYLLPYVKTTKICGLSTASSCSWSTKVLDGSASLPLFGNSNNYYFILSNGVSVSIFVRNVALTINDAGVEFYIDTNGPKLPNVIGKDTFIMELGGNYGAGDKNKLLPFGMFASKSWLLSTAGGCNKTSGGGQRCMAVIIIDGWQIKDDYPW